MTCIQSSIGAFDPSPLPPRYLSMLAARFTGLVPLLARFLFVYRRPSACCRAFTTMALFQKFLGNVVSQQSTVCWLLAEAYFVFIVFYPVSALAPILDVTRFDVFLSGCRALVSAVVVGDGVEKCLMFFPSMRFPFILSSLACGVTGFVRQVHRVRQVNHECPPPGGGPHRSS